MSRTALILVGLLAMSSGPGATVTALELRATKIVAKGSGFTDQVEVFVDGLKFVQPAAVKNGKKVTQKGPLENGQTLGQYLAAHGGCAVVGLCNSNGGLARISIQ